MQKENSSELYLHEWVAVALVAGFIAMLAASAYLSAPPLSQQMDAPHHLVDPTIEVFVQGGVANPGPRRVPRGALLEDVLKAAIPLPDADVGRLNPLAKVRPNQIIKVPFKRPSKTRKREPVDKDKDAQETKKT